MSHQKSSHSSKKANGTAQAPSNSSKLKTNKIAAYDIFGADDRKAPENVADTAAQGAKSHEQEKNIVEMYTHAEELHQDMLIDPKSHHLAIITDSMDSFSKAISMEPSGNNMYFTNSNAITFKSKHFILVSYLLLLFTLLPLQYHNQNFLLQVKKMQDSCFESRGLFTENQSYILDAIFPYGFSSGLEFDGLSRQLNILNRIQKSRGLDNYTLKYMRQEDCVQNNMTSFLNIITVPSRAGDHPARLPPATEFRAATAPTPIVVDSLFVRSLKVRERKPRRQSRAQNLILICDDAFHAKSERRENLAPTSESYFGADHLDVKANVLTQWNISCKSLSSTTATISYSQMTFLSGQIIGAILFSMLADYLGRKRVYLITLYSSTIIGSIASIVQTYKQFVFVRFPIAAITQGCFIMSYVLLFEIILSSKSRNTYCTLFIASQFFWNIFISIASKFFQDWRYMQLTGSLLASLAVGYPWLIKESFKWLIVRDDFSQAERVCKKIFKERNVVARLMKMKLDDQTVGDERNSEGYWPYVIWQPTFRKIISSFVLIWSVVSLVGFFVNEESKKLLANNLNDYSLQNGILFVSNLALCLLYYCRLGKRVPLGLCMILGSLSYLVFSVTEAVAAEGLRLVLLQLAKVFMSCAFNILMLYVCELFPCEIRCSSFSFFISIKHLSEMFAIYIFKMNYTSMLTIRVSLSVCCLIMSLFAFLLPERTAFSFNLDYMEYLSRYNLFKINSTTPPAHAKNMYDKGTANFRGLVSLQEERSSCMLTVNRPNVKKPGKSMFVHELSSVDECEAYILANSLIKKINCENHCKTGKLNPLYEEDVSVLSNNFIGLPSSHNQNVVFGKGFAPQNNSLSLLNKISSSGSQTDRANNTNAASTHNNSQKKFQSIQQTSTKF